MRVWRSLYRWKVYARSQRRLETLIKRAATRLFEFGDPVHVAFVAMQARPPYWRAPAHAAAANGTLVRVSDDGFWARSMSHRLRQAVHGLPVLREGGMYAFAFRVVGSGLGMVVGVCDATDPQLEASDVKAWGLHLTHGALYTKAAGSAQKGSLGTQCLVPALVAERKNAALKEARADGINRDEGTMMAARDVLTDPDASSVAREAARSWLKAAEVAEESVETVIEVHVDTTRRRIAFGLAGGALIEAPVEIAARVRPWAYFWSDNDAVMLEARAPRLHSADRVAAPARKLPVRARQRSPRGAREQPTQSERPPLPPLRARAADGSVPLHPLGRSSALALSREMVGGVSEPMPWGSPRELSPRRLGLAGLPHSPTPRGSPGPPEFDYLPPFLDPAYDPQLNQPGAASPYAPGGRGAGCADGRTPYMLAAEGEVPRDGAESPPLTPTSIGQSTPGRWRFFRLGSSRSRPMSARSEASQKSSRVGSRPASPRGGRKKDAASHMWDVVKPVTESYSDAYQQL